MIDKDANFNSKYLYCGLRTHDKSMDLATRFQKLEIFPFSLFYAAQNITNFELKFYRLIDLDTIYTEECFFSIFQNSEVPILIFFKRASCNSVAICIFSYFCLCIPSPGLWPYPFSHLPPSLADQSNSEVQDTCMAPHA